MPLTHANGGFVPVFDVVRYGAKGDGVTDDYAAVSDAIQAAFDAGGGVVYFPEGTYLIGSQIVMPNTAASPAPTQPPITLLGVSAGPNDGLWRGNHQGGSVLDLHYQGADAKILTLGTGTLEIRGLTFTQSVSAADTTPFLKTTNTTLLLDSNGFYGHSTLSGITCVQDAIILGGTGTVTSSDATGIFQGYNTLIKSSTFSRIRTGIVFQNAANGITVAFNIWSRTCGSGDTTGAVEIKPTGPAGMTAVGNMFYGNYYEATYYTNVIHLNSEPGASATADNMFCGEMFQDNETGDLPSYCWALESGVRRTMIYGCRTDGLTASVVNDIDGTGSYVFYGPNRIDGSVTFTGNGVFQAATTTVASLIANATSGSTPNLDVQDDGSTVSRTIAQIGHGTGLPYWIVQNSGNPTSNRTLQGIDHTGTATLFFDPDNGQIRCKSYQAGIATPTYGASITPDARAGRWQTITATNGTAFTINAPSNPPSSARTCELTIEVSNTSGGALGAITWNAAFVFAGQTWTSPANGKKRYARFEWNGANWICTGVASADY